MISIIKIIRQGDKSKRFVKSECPHCGCIYARKLNDCYKSSVPAPNNNCTSAFINVCPNCGYRYMEYIK